MSGPIANYLDEIDDVLAFDPRLSRRVRDEIESHLFDTAEQVGEADAVRRFGRPSDIARAYAEAALPDRLRRSCAAAGLLGGATLLLMQLRTAILDIPGGTDPLTWFDRVGLLAALACIGAAWWIASRGRIATVRRWLHFAAGSLALSVGASLLRAYAASGDAAFTLIAGSALIELLLLAGLMAQLARLDRYARRLAV
ncbi:HAAS signaling domain-containing protein [Sphingopyxis sp.]|uniref:HAAS signaling domain-containing protein n=1 Tax=Sphingopyxis sp. TaxID=1908224 RepID=UPI003D0B55D0